MKKIICLSAFSGLLFLAACNDEKKSAETTKPVPADTKTEVVVVKPAPTIIVKEPSAKPVVIVREPTAKPTTIVLDKNGVKVGTKKIDVVIKRDNNR